MKQIWENIHIPCVPNKAKKGSEGRNRRRQRRESSLEKPQLYWQK